MLSEAKRRISLLVGSAHEGAATTRLFLFLRVRIDLFLSLRLARDRTFVSVSCVFFLILHEGTLAGVTLSHLGVLERHFLVGRCMWLCGREHIFYFGEHGRAVVII